MLNVVSQDAMARSTLTQAFASVRDLGIKIYRASDMLRQASVFFFLQFKQNMLMRLKTFFCSI